MKVSSTITDFPVFFQTETFFKKSKKAGLDGLEFVLGVKSRFEYARISYLSEKYDLPITSIHQPAWSGLRLYFDESFVKFAKKLGVKNIVFHPLVLCSFESHVMESYFKRLLYLQEKYDISILLENMSTHDFVYRKLFKDKKEKILDHLEALNMIADTHGFLMTYDVSHAEITDPATSEIFQRLLPKIGNIHMSSFTAQQHHLPLTKGVFKTEKFIQYLQEKKYKGLLTLEIRPPIKKIFENYDFKGIADSVSLIKKSADK